MSDTYKAVFECKALQERVVWYVSSRKEAQRMVRHHVTKRNGRPQARYQGQDWTLTVRKMFDSSDCVGYDSSLMGWGGL